MGEMLDVPPFPPLTWDTSFWAGEVYLPSWAGFQSRHGSYAAVSKAAPSDGIAHLYVKARDKARPTPEQAAAFRHLLDHEAAVAEAVWQALLAYYPDEREAYLKGYGLTESEDVPEVTTVDGLRPLVGLGGVHVLSLARDGVACLGFELGCVWDDEHGAGVMTHRGRVIAVGQADRSFVEWMAEEGLDGE